MKKENVVTNEMESFYWDLQEKVSKTHKTFDLEAVRSAFGVLFTFNMMEALISKRLQSADMTMPGLNVLMLLAHGHPQGCPLSALSKLLVSSRSNITGVVDSLVLRGLVARVGRPDDRRVVLAQITEKGREWLSDYFPGHAQMMSSFADPLNSKERLMLLTLLAKMRRGMRATFSIKTSSTKKGDQ